MVTALQRKLIRDLWKMRGQAFAIMAVVACGIASYVAMLSVHSSVERSAQEYFEKHRLPDVFARVAYAPESVERQLAEIEDVDAVETRLVEPASLEVAGLPEPAVGTLVALRPPGAGGFNVLHVRRGRLPDPARTNEAAVEKGFAEANGLVPGDTLTALVGGRRVVVRVVGIVLSPEYIYTISPGSLFPDPKRFGVLWMDEKALATLVDHQGTFNDVGISLARGASQEEVLAQIDAILEPHGGRGAHGRDKQASFRFVTEELKGLETMGGTVPIMFLAVAAFLLNVVLTRLISGQREQIAALKALGYSNLSVGIHFTEMMVVIVLGGVAMGGALGRLLGDALLGVYHQYFAFPDLDFRMDYDLLAGATALSLICGFIGIIAAVRGAVRLPPAEAMRPQAPASYRRGLLSMLGLPHLLGPTGRIVLRNIERRPGRMLMSSVGIAFGIAIMISGTFSMDALDYIMEVNFQKAQRQDVTVSFTHPIGKSSLQSLQSLPGVLTAEGTRNVPIRLRHEHASYETGLQGLAPEGDLRRLLDAQQRPVPLPATGILLTDVLGDRLAVVPGDVVEVEILEGRPRTREVVVAGLIEETMGLNAYADIGFVNRLMDEGPLVSGALLLVDSNAEGRLYSELNRQPAVAAVSLRTAAYDAFMQTSGQMQGATAVILGILAAIVTIGVVYNGARVLLAERARELASLRVLGFTRGEVSTILLGELGVHLVVAVPIGCLLGYGFALSLISSIDTEIYRFPLIINARTYVVASLVALTSGTIAALLVRRRVDDLDLVAVLKTRE